MDEIRERLDRIERLLEEQTNRFDKIYDVILALDAYCRQGKVGWKILVDALRDFKSGLKNR